MGGIFGLGGGPTSRPPKIVEAKPIIPKPVVLPTPNDAAAAAARAREAALVASRSGRASTILTNGGGGAYSDSLLGQ